MLEMSTREKFLFDLQGFLHVEGVLSPAEVKAMNDAIDAHIGDEYADDFFPREDGVGYGGGMDGQYNARTFGKTPLPSFPGANRSSAGNTVLEHPLRARVAYRRVTTCPHRP